MKDLRPLLVKLQGLERFQRLLPGVPATAGMKSGYITLKPGESVGEHKTEAKEESIVILEGAAEIYCEGELLFVAWEKSLVYIPPEVSHDIKNNSDRDLRYVYVVSPAARS